MKKFKVNENLLALLMFGSMFAGWQCMIIVVGFIWAFCETGKNLKDLTIKVLALFGACAVTMLAWDVVTQAIITVFGGLRKFFEMLVSWGVSFDLVDGYDKYFYNPICQKLIIEIVGEVLTLIVMVVKFKFIYSVITNKEMKGAFFPVQLFLDKVTDFANNNFYEEDKAPKAASVKGKFCPKCGEKVEDDASFCTSCGNKF